MTKPTKLSLVENPVNPDAVRVLEEALEMAKAGETLAAAVGGVRKQRPIHPVVALLLAIFTFLVVSHARAQGQQRPQTYTLTFTPQEVQVIGTALIARPYSEVAVLMQKLQKQIDEQNKPSFAGEVMKGTPETKK